MESQPSKNRKVIASVQRALDILNLFDGSHSELGNTEIAKQLDLDPGTAAGLIYTLKLNNYLDQNPSTRKYRLGLRLAERAAVLLDGLDLRKIAVPFLEELREWCGESVNLAIRDGREVVYIERLFGTHSLAIRSELGKRAPIHSTALGKAIVAHMNLEEAQALIANYPFVKVTRHTITDPVQFQEELLHIRQVGFAVDEQENEMGGRCVAAPIYGYDGIAFAAASISVPIQRLPSEKVAEYGERVRNAASRISRNLGYQAK